MPGTALITRSRHKAPSPKSQAQDVVHTASFHHPFHPSTLGRINVSRSHVTRPPTSYSDHPFKLRIVSLSTSIVSIALLLYLLMHFKATSFACNYDYYLSHLI